MNTGMFYEQMAFNPKGFITYIEFISRFKYIVPSRNIPVSNNYSPGLLNKLMFGMIYEINEFIKREKWECSKYLEMIGALIEILPEGEVEKEITNSGSLRSHIV